MNMQRLLACSFLVLLSACSAECSCNGGDDDEDGTTSQGGGTPTGQGGATGAGGDGEGGGTTTGQGGGGGEGGGTTEGGVQVRVAHLSPDAAAFNVCLVDVESGEERLLLDEAGIEFGSISEYGGVFSGRYDVVLTAPGATDCGTSLGTLAGVDLDLDTAQTIGIIGLAGADEGDPDALGLTVYPDDVAAPEAGKVKARFVHAAPGAPSVDIGYLDEEGAFVPLWLGTSYPNDAGYVDPDLDAFVGLELVAILAGTGDEPNPLLTVTIDGPADSIVEGFAVGTTQTGIDVVTVTTQFGE